MTPSDEGVRLDVFLTARLAGITRSQLRQWIGAGCVSVAGRELKAGLALRAGDQVSVEAPVVTPSALAPVDLPLELVYQDEAIAVVVKPAGLAVHPAPGWTGPTLVHVLLARLSGLSGVGGVERPGIVHRLDKDTTGLMVVAKTDHAHEQLRRQFHDRDVEKVYLALVLGRPSAPEGLIDAPIGRHPTDRKRMSSTARRGRPARTRWRRLEDLGPAALLEVRLETGRTHQIRAHLSEAGHPIVGDATYGFEARVRGVVDPVARRILARATRPMLHAFRLAFRHPLDQRPLSFEAPWPTDLTELVAELRRASQRGHAKR
ncbi:MAG: RluA family pseudouridine synthase [bacterium]